MAYYGAPHRILRQVVTAVELMDQGKIKRMYALKIDNYPAKELETIFL